MEICTPQNIPPLHLTTELSDYLANTKVYHTTPPFYLACLVDFPVHMYVLGEHCICMYVRDSDWRGSFSAGGAYSLE